MIGQHLARNVVRLFPQNVSAGKQKVLFWRIMSTSSLSNADAEMRIAIAQMRATNNKAENLLKVEELVQKAKEQQAKFLFLPECCDFVGENRQETLELSEPLTGATVAAYSNLAKNNELWLSLGGIHESILDNNGKRTDKIFNAHVIINSCGDIAGVYRKLHLFDVNTPDFRFRESDVVEKGPHLIPPLNTPIGKLGVQICYDLRFAEAAITLRKLGAEILTYPSAFAYATGKAHWETLLRARAIENQCFVVAPAQTGFHNKKRQSYGHAMVISPWGKILIGMGEEELNVATVTLNFEEIKTVRENMPCFEHRRADVYTLTAIDTSQLQGVDRNFGNQIIPKETIFFESPLSFAFTNLHCVVQGHILISPKRAVPRLKDMNHDEIADLFATTCKMQRMLEDFYQTSAATVTVQDGADAGQTIQHVHFHVMPRRPGDFRINDEIYVHMDMVKQGDRREFREMADEAEDYRKFCENSFI